MPGAPHIHPGKDMGCARFINKLLQSRQCSIGIAYDGMLATDPLKRQSLPRSGFSQPAGQIDSLTVQPLDIIASHICNGPIVTHDSVLRSIPCLPGGFSQVHGNEKAQLPLGPVFAVAFKKLPVGV